MHVIVLIMLGVIWICVQVQIEKISRDAGEPLLSRKQMKYLRRKAHRTGKTLDTVPYKPKTRQSPIFLRDWLGPDGKPLQSSQSLPPGPAHNTLQYPSPEPPHYAEGASEGTREDRFVVGAVLLAVLGIAGFVVWRESAMEPPQQPLLTQAAPTPPQAQRSAQTVSTPLASAAQVRPAPPVQTVQMAAPHPATPPAALSGTSARTRQGANVRTAPSGSAEVVQTLRSNTPVEVVEMRGTWAKVAPPNSPPIGWVFRPLLDCGGC